MYGGPAGGEAAQSHARLRAGGARWIGGTPLFLRVGVCFVFFCSRAAADAHRVRFAHILATLVWPTFRTQSCLFSLSGALPALPLGPTCRSLVLFITRRPHADKEGRHPMLRTLCCASLFFSGPQSWEEEFCPSLRPGRGERPTAGARMRNRQVPIPKHPTHNSLDFSLGCFLTPT